MRKIYLTIVYFSVIIFISFFGCDDYGLAPPGEGNPENSPAILAGRIYFIGEMPENVQFCWVVVAYDRPPGDALDFSYLAAYQEVNLPLESDTFDFRIELDPDTVYNWVFVTAVGNVDSVGPWNIIGQYNVPGDTIPQSIDPDYGDSIWIEIIADLDSVHIP
ncbi:hypothetical protein J7M00_07855 [bacterium]|nr:hypothetical protein [bacterium]